MKKTVLVVDDDEGIRDALCFVLQDEGFVVTTAAHGGEALEHLRTASELPDLVLLDLMMPVMDGFLFLDAVRPDSRLAGIPIIIMSAMSRFRREALGPNVVGALKKPLKIDDILRLIEQSSPPG